MKNDLEVNIHKHGDISVIEMLGDVTANTGQQVEEAYNKISEDGVKRIILAFNEDNYINSGGIAFLIGIAAESKGRGQVIRVAGLSEHFHKIFDMMGLTRYMDLFPTLEKAIEDFEN
jgi:anti-anti-sigma factor